MAIPMFNAKEKFLPVFDKKQNEWFVYCYDSDIPYLTEAFYKRLHDVTYYNYEDCKTHVDELNNGKNSYDT